MATYTTNYNLKKPALADKIRIADFNGNSDTIDGAMHDNAVLGAQLKADIGIVENTNTATHNISAGQYVIWKGDLYTASDAISSGATLSNANLTAVSGGGLNALNDKLTWTKIADESTTANTNFDQNISVSYPNYPITEIMFTLQRVSNGRTFASSVIPFNQFNGGAIYAIGSYTIFSAPYNDPSATAKIINAVAIYTDSTHIEIAVMSNDESIKARVWVR